MKKIILKLFNFSILLYLLAYLLDFLISTNLKKSNLYQGEIEIWNDIYQSKINSDLLILGSSRAWVQVDPKIITKENGIKTYNLGMDGHKFDLTYLRYLEYIKYNKKPKYILMMVDVNFFSRHSKFYNYEQFLPYMMFNLNYFNFFNSYNFFKKIDYVIPLIRYSGKINVIKNAISNITFKKNKKYRNLGFKGQLLTWHDLDSSVHSLKIELDHNKLIMFNSFVIQCRKTKTNLILVYPPEHIEGQKLIQNRNEITAVLKMKAKLNKLVYLDYSQDSTFLRNKKMFYNAFHLNNRGAYLFTQKLSKDLKYYLINE